MSAAIEQRNQDATCYCGNLDEGASEELLWELMIQAGPVINVHMPRDKVTNTHQGYGFVEFRSEEDAEYAIKVLNMVKLFGKPLRVNKASQDRKAQDVGANLFIGQLDPEVDEKLLYDTFSAFGFITNTPKVMRDPDTGASKGYGFVSYDGFEASDLAIECMNGQHLCNRQIVVQYAYKKDSHGERHGGLSERLLAANNPLRFKPHTMFASEQGQLPDIQQLAAPALSSGQPLLPTSTIPMPSTSYLPLPPPPPPGTYVPSQIPQYLTMNQGGMYQMPPPTPPPPPPQFHGFNGMPVPPAPPTGGQFGLPYGMPPQPPFRPPSPTKSLAPPPMLSAPGAQKPIGVPPGMQFPPPPPPSFMFPPPPPTLGSHPPSMPSQMEKSTGINGQNGLQDSSELDNISQMKMLSNFPNFLQNKEDTGEHHGIFTPVPPPHDMSMPVHNMPQNLLKGHEILPFQGQMDFSMPPPPPQTFQSDQNMDMEDSYMPSSPTRDIEFPQIQLTPNMFPSTGVNFPPGANPYIPNLAPPPPPTH